MVRSRVARRQRRADRISTILELVATDGSVDVADLAGRFAVSAATVRRDLALLDEQRLVNRSHGGAHIRDVAYELPVRYRRDRQLGAKKAIATAAMRLLPTGPTVVALNGGTTTSAVARQLIDRDDIAVVTNAVNIAMTLLVHPHVKVLLTGGAARPRSYELVGPYAEQTLTSINARIAFIGVDGLSATAGLTTHDEIEAATDRALLQRAQRVVIVADATKIGHRTLATIAPISAAHDLITDNRADPTELDALRQSGLTIHLIGVQDPVQ